MWGALPFGCALTSSKQQRVLHQHDARRLHAQARAARDGDPTAKHVHRLGPGEPPFIMGDGIDNWYGYACTSKPDPQAQVRPCAHTLGAPQADVCEGNAVGEDGDDPRHPSHWIGAAGRGAPGR